MRARVRLGVRTNPHKWTGSHTSHEVMIVIVIAISVVMAIDTDSDI